MTRFITVSSILATLAASPAVLAQDDELIGTWEVVIEPEEGVEASGYMTLEADHTVEFGSQVHLGPEFIFGDVGEGELPDIPIFTEGFAMTITLHGTWQAENGVLTLHMEEFELLLNDMTVEEFFREMASQFAVVFAEDTEIADEEFAEFEEGFVEGFMMELNADEFEEMLIADFREDAVNTYEVDGNSMFFFEDGEVASEFRRITPSVVAQSTWGQVKAATLR